MKKNLNISNKKNIENVYSKKDINANKHTNKLNTNLNLTTNSNKTLKNGVCFNHVVLLPIITIKEEKSLNNRHIYNFNKCEDLNNNNNNITKSLKSRIKENIENYVYTKNLFKENINIDKKNPCILFNSNINNLIKKLNIINNK